MSRAERLPARCRIRAGIFPEFRHPLGRRADIVPLCGRVRVARHVLSKGNPALYLRLIKAAAGGRFQIGSNRGRING